MKPISTYALHAFGLMLLSLAGGCSAGDIEQTGENSEALAPSTETDDATGATSCSVEVDLDCIGNPTWKPVDFHHFSAPWEDAVAIFEDILPPPHHLPHPQLGIGPGAPHGGPYHEEIGEGVDDLGYTDKSTFTAAEFTEGVLLAWMNVPNGNGSPKGTSPDFQNGPIIPNAVSPIHVTIRFVREDVVDPSFIEFDVPALDQSLSPPFNVKGHSHFPIFGSDSAVFYGGLPAEGSYERWITMIDTTGGGWDIRVPFEVN